MVSRVFVPDRWLVICLDPELQGITLSESVFEGGRQPKPSLARSWAPEKVSRDLAAMEEACARAFSTHLGRDPTGSSIQQIEKIVLNP